MAEQWYYAQQGQRQGPVAEEQLKQLASSGQLKPTDKVWKKDMAAWEAASSLPWWSSMPTSSGNGASTPQSNTPRPRPPQRVPPLPASGNQSVPRVAAATRIVQCPKCSTRLKVLAAATRGQCPKCKAAIAIPPAVSPVQAPVQPQLKFLPYCFQHFAATHWPAAIGICCGVIALPFISLLKPLLGFRGLCFVLAGSLILSVASGIIYFIQRSMAYSLGGERTIPPNTKSWMARLAYGGLTFLVPMAPLVGAEYFTPDYGLLATIVPEFRKDQAKWLRLPSSEGEKAVSAAASPSASPEPSATAATTEESKATMPPVPEEDRAVAQQAKSKPDEDTPPKPKTKPKSAEVAHDEDTSPKPKAQPKPASENEEPAQARESNASTDEKATQTVLGKGAGTTEDEALKDAFRDAVRQVVGAVVDAETVVKNDDVINDQVLTYSDGFIKEQKVVSTKRMAVLVRTTIQATVERRKVIQKLQAANVTVKKIEGQSLFAEVVTQQDAKANATALLKKALADLPTMLTAEMVGKPTYDADKGEAVLQISIKPDRKAFDAFRERLEKVLDVIAIRKDSALLHAEAQGIPLRVANTEGPMNAYIRTQWWVWVNSFHNETYTTTRWNGYLVNDSPVEMARVLFGETRIALSFLDSTKHVISEDECDLAQSFLIKNALHSPSEQWFFLTPLRCFVTDHFPMDGPPTTINDYARSISGGHTIGPLYIAPYFFDVYRSRITYCPESSMERRIKLTLGELKRITDVRCKVTFQRKDK